MYWISLLFQPLVLRLLLTLPRDRRWEALQLSRFPLPLEPASGGTSCFPPSAGCACRATCSLGTLCRLRLQSDLLSRNPSPPPPAPWLELGVSHPVVVEAHGQISTTVCAPDVKAVRSGSP